jgi:hypothetical protein
VRRRRRRFAVVRRERRDEVGESGERAGTNADQAQPPAQVDALQAAAGGAPDRARIERVRRQRQVARRDLEVVEAQLDADRLGGVRLARQVAGELLAQLGEDRAQLGAIAHRVEVAARRWSRG